MAQFIDWYNMEAHTLHPVERAAKVHADFVGIHPFVDGNKRTGLALMLVLLREGGIAATFDHGELLHSILSVANGDLDYDGLLTFVRKSVRP